MKKQTKIILTNVSVILMAMCTWYFFGSSKSSKMTESINIWSIKEFEGDGVSCPVIPANLPWYKKATLTFCRF